VIRDVDEIKTAVGNYQNKLKAAIAETGNETVSMTQQVTSNILDMR
jgi:flagellin-like hook-associated protein FlgL